MCATLFSIFKQLNSCVCKKVIKEKTHKQKISTHIFYTFKL